MECAEIGKCKKWNVEVCAEMEFARYSSEPKSAGPNKRAGISKTE